MEMTLDQRTIDAIAYKTAIILEKRMKKQEVPEYITCKEAATLRGIKPQRMRQIKDKFRYTKKGDGEKQGQLMFLKSDILKDMQ